MKRKAQSPHHQLLALQKKIFKSLKAETRRLMGDPPQSILRYERECGRDFREFIGARPAKRIHPIDKKELIRRIRRADVTFIGDFHTFAQAQRSALRMIREAVEPDESWLLGLEFIPSQFQKEVDSYLEGGISLQRFLEKISYKEEWGFPWENYAPILEWAKQNSIRIIALNAPRELIRRDAKAGVRELHNRDRWAAGIISDLFAQQDRKTRMVVLYGEHHVGSKHLPLQLTRVSRRFLGKPLRSITVHQNHDELYWRLAEQGKEVQVEAVRLGKDVYCVLSSTPWTKLQSLASWAEGGAAAQLLDNDGFEMEGSVDYLSLMRIYGDTIAEFVGVQPPSFEALTVKTINEADFIDELGGREFNRHELKLIRHHVLSNQRIYVPRVQIAYLASPSQNGAAELAAIHLLRTINRANQLFDPRDPDDFFRLVIESAFGFFGSLIINPRRKCDLPEDHRRRLRELRRGSAEAYPFEKKARQLALSVLELSKLSADPERTERKIGKALPAGPSSSPIAAMAARFVGQILGKRLYPAILDEELTIQSARKLCLARSPARLEYQDRYRELLEAIVAIRLARSKNQSL